MEDKTLHVLLIKENDWWVAQCLEVDIAAQSKGEIKDAVEEMCEVLTGRIHACQMEGVNPWALPAAPDEYRKRFEKAPRLEFDREPLFIIPMKYQPEWRLAA